MVTSEDSDDAYDDDDADISYYDDDADDIGDAAMQRSCWHYLLHYRHILCSFLTCHFVTPEILMSTLLADACMNIKKTGMHKRQSNSKALLVNDKTLLWLKPRMIMRIEGL